MSQEALVEKVARALLASDEAAGPIRTKLTYDQQPSYQRKMYDRLARAALASLPHGGVRELFNRLESYHFECEAGPLENCVDYQELKSSLTEQLGVTRVLMSIDAAIAQEREECANIITEIALEASANDGELWILNKCLEAIRSRGDHSTEERGE